MLSKLAQRNFHSQGKNNDQESNVIVMKPYSLIVGWRSDRNIFTAIENKKWSATDSTNQPSLQRSALVLTAAEFLYFAKKFVNQAQELTASTVAKISSHVSSPRVWPEPPD